MDKQHKKCKHCIYFRIDEENGDYCKRTYSSTTSESNCDCFLALDELSTERSKYV